jgi:hypothetical protein
MMDKEDNVKNITKGSGYRVIKFFMRSNPFIRDWAQQIGHRDRPKSMELFVSERKHITMKTVLYGSISQIFPKH